MSAAGPYARKVRPGDGGPWGKGGPALARLDIELTERCNFGCVHCSVCRPAGDVAAIGGELDALEFKSVMEEAASLGCLTVRFTGGEPLLRDDFAGIYLSARRLGLRVMLFTNASLLTAETAELLAKYPPLEKVEVTVYGLSAGSARSATGNAAAYEASMKGIGLLLEKGVPFVVKGALIPPDGPDMERFESWASGLPSMKGEKPALALAYGLRTRRDSAERNEMILAARPAPEDIVRLEAERDPEWREFRSFVAGRHSLHGDRLFVCAPTRAAAVDAFGRLQYCLSLRHPGTVYDLKRGSLADGVGEFLPEVARLKAGNGDYLERCARCFLRDACLQCPGWSWAEHGTLDTPVEYVCRLTHLKAEAAGLIAAGEKAWLAGPGGSARTTSIAAGARPGTPRRGKDRQGER